jgi:hypothetical protein
MLQKFTEIVMVFGCQRRKTKVSAQFNLGRVSQGNDQLNQYKNLLLDSD